MRRSLHSLSSMQMAERAGRRALVRRADPGPAHFGVRTRVVGSARCADLSPYSEGVRKSNGTNARKSPYDAGYGAGYRRAMPHFSVRIQGSAASGSIRASRKCAQRFPQRCQRVCDRRNSSSVMRREWRRASSKMDSTCFRLSVSVNPAIHS